LLANENLEIFPRWRPPAEVKKPEMRCSGRTETNRAVIVGADGVRPGSAKDDDGVMAHGRATPLGKAAEVAFTARGFFPKMKNRGSEHPRYK
jgi:hypothetical protein